MNSKDNLVGLIPAGGLATRLGNLPCSKEIYPTQLWVDDKNEPRVISENLIKYYQQAGCSHVYFILREGKWDIPGYYGDGRKFGIPIGYLIMDLPYGTPFTLDQAYPYVKDKYVALGFPDIVMKPRNAFKKLYSQILKTEADVVLGLFPIDTPEKWDMCRLDENGQVTELVIKQTNHDLKFGWSIAVWSPRFTEFLHQYIERVRSIGHDCKIQSDNGLRETYVGDIFMDAMKNGYKFESVLFEEGSTLDIGTPEDLKRHIETKTKL